MVRGIVKKGLIGAGLGAAVLFGLFGTKACYYTRYAANKVRETAQSAVPFEAHVDAARQQVQDLRPAIDQGVETLAKLDQSIKDVQGEIVALHKQVDRSGREIQRLRASLDDAGVQRVSSADTKTRLARIELSRHLDVAKRAKYILEVKQSELDHRQIQRQKLHDSLMEMKVKREALLSKIQELEAKHDAMQFTHEFDDITIDTGPLAEAEQAVAELDRRMELESHTNDLKAQFSDDRESAFDPALDRDVLREADEFLGSEECSDRDAEKEL